MISATNINSNQIYSMNQQLLDIVLKAADEVNQELDQRIPIEQGAEAPLFGTDGVLDSIALVSLVVAVEEAISDNLGANLTLADEKAMSQKNSPFKSIASLVDYTDQLLREDNGS